MITTLEKIYFVGTRNLGAQNIVLGQSGTAARLERRTQPTLSVARSACSKLMPPSFESLTLDLNSPEVSLDLGFRTIHQEKIKHQRERGGGGHQRGEVEEQHASLS